MYNPRNPHLILAFLLLAITNPSFCLAWTGKVVSVTDGDTIKILHHGKKEQVKLYGIVAPDKQQSSGKNALGYLSSFVKGEVVEIEHQKKDKYGRTMGLVSLGGQNINELMVQAGHACVDRKYCTEEFCSEWSKMEDAAKEMRQGLWSQATKQRPGRPPEGQHCN